MPDVLELFSGTESVGRVFIARGYDVTSVDNGAEWKKGGPWGTPTHFMDAREFYRLNPNERYLFGWASVPCQRFSVAVIGRNWTHDHQPKNDGAREALELLRETVAYLERTCQYFLIENPRGKMRRIVEKEFPHLTRYETTWCKYRAPGQPMKPSDLFGRMPGFFAVYPPCRNGDSCHINAPRGSTTGTQGNELRLKGIIPERLTHAIINCLEVATHE